MSQAFLHDVFGAALLVGGFIGGILLAKAWIDSILDQIEQGEWGFLLVFIGLPLLIVAAIGYRMTA